MDQYFREAFEGLQSCAQHLMAASQEINQAGADLVKVTSAALHAKNEHEDLRETVHQVQQTVLDLVREVRALKERRNGDA
jgi:hypothetical protein